jgi:hypothetical protein
MKKLVGIAAIAILFSLTINAQEKKENIKKRAPLTSEQSATLQSKKMALHLDLDKNQQAAVYKLMKKNAEERQLKREEISEKRKKGVALTKEERFQLQNDRLDKQLEQKAAMKNILSKEQYEKWEKTNFAKKRNARKKMEKSNRMNQKGEFRDRKRVRQHRQEIED